ncbi:DAK2 domain-containing protein [Deltaproteobacteria bacterium OttesenSCG-928-K17]|nr:DAK2 domain-containing protein [Deltaproteobacteria bacterium OttesenSCG-928-K17]
MLLDRARLKTMLLSVADIWRQNADSLSEIDSRFGDGDHGVTINKIAALLAGKTEAWREDQSIKEFIEDIGAGIMAISGGSAGPLYGTMIGGLAEALENQTEIDGPLLKKMLAASLEEMRGLTTACPGEKTMMDALIPAAEAAASAAGGPIEILAAAAEAATDGAEKTRDMVARFGRAKSYGEQTLGCVDAGALSTALFFKGLAKALN